MENISLNSDKRGRGRPIRLESFNTRIGEYKMIYPDVNTKRGLYNQYYGCLGLDLIVDTQNKIIRDPVFSHLFNIATGKMKRTILSELGKIASKYSSNEATELAKEICRNKMSTKSALNYLSMVRGLGKDRTGGIIKQFLNILNASFLSKPEIKDIQFNLNQILNNYLEDVE